ncbi:hypothetical protein UA45_09070 [Morganella morganii]|uniref:Uncharacterized protein n=1 Tax=Morganella morganii TaxID=582 RepID=A0A0D8LB60_MORMO|nr:hypothetical protein UA45_09070 [Morganella morganii]
MVKMKYILLLLIAIMPNALNAMILKNIEIKDTGITVTKDPAEGEINACKNSNQRRNNLSNFLNHLKCQKKINGCMNITHHVYQPEMLS